MRSRPILHPPIQVSHLYYRLTRILVWGGITRYFSISGVDDFEGLPAPGTPAIFIGNHQNGLMDPMPFSGFVPQQIHWLTRADVFWNPVARHILWGYNQMPVYRQRDRVDQLRERNDVIFDACVDRMHAGAAMGIFPEGNHNPFPSLRALKGGLAEMLARAARRHPELKSIQLVPIGLDYEHYLDWRRRFRVRAGQAIPFADLLNEDGTIDKPALNARVREAFRRIMVDLQPEDAQPHLHPALRAHRTTEMSQEVWKPFTAKLAAWVKRMMDRFGEEPDVTSMVFAVGLQEAGQGAKRFKKDEKMDLMHVGVCTLLEPLGYYVREGVDEDGWPHFSSGEPLPPLTSDEQEVMMKRALVDYFAAWIGREGAENE